MACGSAVPAFAVTQPVDGTPEGYTYSETGTAPADAKATESGNGVVEDTYHQFGTMNSSETSATSSGAEGVHVSYSTVGGTWTDSGPDDTITDDNVEYPNGTFQVTVPKEIKYENMHVGKFDLTDTYDVWIRGVIPNDKAVHLSASGIVTLVNPLDNDLSNFGSEATAQVTWERNFTEKGVPKTLSGNYWDTNGGPTFSAFDVYGSSSEYAADDGGAPGSISEDKVNLKGYTTSVGTWQGNITYTATLVPATGK